MLGLSWTSFRARALPVLTTTSHATAPFIGIFLVVHLSAPALANIGGAGLASQTMLLGREYYQTAVGEPLLLLAPLALHAVSGVLKRLLCLLPSSSKAQPYLRPLTSPLSLSALALFILLPTHFFTHRLYPTLPTPPILAVGPAELDFAFVQTGLRLWPWRSALMYAGLVGAGILHVVEGRALMLRTYWPSKRQLDDKAPLIEDQAKLRSHGLAPRTKRLLAALLVALPVLTGVYTLAREPTFVFKDLAARYQAVFLQSWVHRIL